MTSPADDPPAFDVRVPARRRGLAGLVLCGGASRRMGHDKALLRDLAGGDTDGPRTRLEAAIARLDEWVERGWIACGAAPRYEHVAAGERNWDLVLDPLPDAGPLAGLAAGLAAGSQEWTLVLAVDMPGVGAAQLGALLESARTGDDVVCFEDERGPQPLAALYHRRCREPVRAALAAGERRMISFWSRPSATGRPLVVRRVPSPGGAECLRNVNTPAEWALERSSRTVEE